MKKVLISTFILVFIILFSLTANDVVASNCSNYGGATTYCDDGTSYSNYGGSTTYGSDGTRYSNYGGSTTYGSDGSTQSKYDCHDIGSGTTMCNDGSTYRNYGGSTTYGSGSGKMITIPNRDDSKYSSGDSSPDNYGGTPLPDEDNPILDDSTFYGEDRGTTLEGNSADYSNYDLERLKEERERRNKELCPSNAVFIASVQKCECIFRYKYDGTSCVYNGLTNNPTDEIEPLHGSGSTQKSMDEVMTERARAMNADSNDVKIDKAKAENKGGGFVWWNPLTWWSGTLWGKKENQELNQCLATAGGVVSVLEKKLNESFLAKKELSPSFFGALEDAKKKKMEEEDRCYMRYK